LTTATTLSPHDQLAQYIEATCNVKRIHSSLGNLMLWKFETRWKE
jgi:hypothetical protein